MCGIVGFVNAGRERATRDILERMNACIVHRGPDEDGFYVKDSVALAMRRLAIIDLSGGQQPIFNSDRTKAIVFNGEIYNFQTLRADLEKQGDEFLYELRHRSNYSSLRQIRRGLCELSARNVRFCNLGRKR